MNNKWRVRYLELAKQVAQWSKDPSTKVGAVIIAPGNIPRSFGFNGFARGCDDNPKLYEDREFKHRHVIHAETNAILNARGSVEGCTIYITHPPCNHCAGLIIQSGIKEVCFPYPEDGFKERWNYTDTLEVLRAGNVVVKSLR